MLKRRLDAGRWARQALYSMLHYMIHTCSFARLTRACRGLEDTINWELSAGEETGITPVRPFPVVL